MNEEMQQLKQEFAELKALMQQLVKDKPKTISLPKLELKPQIVFDQRIQAPALNIIPDEKAPLASIPLSQLSVGSATCPICGESLADEQREVKLADGIYWACRTCATPKGLNV